MQLLSLFSFFFFFNDTATTEIYTLSLHDALPICSRAPRAAFWRETSSQTSRPLVVDRSEEHTSELQSLAYLVCRLLLEKKKKKEMKVSCMTYTNTLQRMCELTVMSTWIMTSDES